MKKFKSFLSKKKKGATSLYFLWFMTFWFVMLLIFLNFIIQMGVYQRVNLAVEEAAKMRATAIDIPKKEDLGEIWIIRPDSSGGGSYAYVSGKESQYKTAFEKADDYARDAAKNYIDTFSGKNSANQEIIDDVKLCFDYTNLNQSTKKTHTFSCVIDGETISKTVTLSSVDDNTKSGIEVKNVVFVGIKVKQNEVFRLTNLASYGGVTEFTSSAVAYPQIDECVKSACGSNY